jgi:hypothetical protein
MNNIRKFSKNRVQFHTSENQLCHMITLTTISWSSIYQSLNEKGYAIIPSFLSVEECHYFVDHYANGNLYRSIINMQRYRFGKGEYKYFSYPLPERIQTMREGLYRPLAMLANDWMSSLAIATQFPLDHKELIEQCANKNQLRPTPLILRYETSGFNTLHQDLYGEVYFPFQVVFALSQYGEDYEGGEFVLVEQLPRAQSKAEVVKLNRGDALIFTTNFRPVKGTKGYYRAKMKHGLSPLLSGIRYALGVIFHNAS